MKRYCEDMEKTISASLLPAFTISSTVFSRQCLIGGSGVIRQSPDKSIDTDLLTTWFIPILQAFFMT